jgi:hypothetical protein
MFLTRSMHGAQRRSRPVQTPQRVRWRFSWKQMRSWAYREVGLRGICEDRLRADLVMMKARWKPLRGGWALAGPLVDLNSMMHHRYAPYSRRRGQDGEPHSTRAQGHGEHAPPAEPERAGGRRGGHVQPQLPSCEYRGRGAADPSQRPGLTYTPPHNTEQEPAILYNLRQRFLRKHPYTYTGDMAIAVNPYEWLEHLYREELRETYLFATDRASLEPHVYAISAEAYRWEARPMLTFRHVLTHVTYPDVAMGHLVCVRVVPQRQGREGQDAKPEHPGQRRIRGGQDRDGQDPHGPPGVHL